MSVSAGKIISGQGTESITVERPSPAYEPVTATVEIGGYSNQCKTEKDSTKSPEELSHLPLKIDEFVGVNNCEMERQKLDSFVFGGLKSDPLIQGFIIVHGGKYGTRNQVQARIANFKANLSFRPQSLNRITFIDGGFREELSVEFWLGDKGRSVPIPTPTVYAKDVKLKALSGIRKEPCM